MKISAWVSLGFILFCLGCSAIAADDQNADGRRFNGKIILLVADNFKKQTSEIHYELLSDEDGSILSLQFSNPDDKPDVKSGARVEIFGRQHNGRIVVDSLRVLTTPDGGQ